MNTLNFETGLVTFSVNDKAEVSFNPTDSNFVSRLFDAFDRLAKKQEARKNEVSKLSDPAEAFELARQQDKEMRDMIDAVFEKPVSDDIFGSMSAYALAGGLPLWCNFLMAVIDQIDATMVQEKKLTNPRIDKYMAKYHK